MQICLFAFFKKKYRWIPIDGARPIPFYESLLPIVHFRHPYLFFVTTNALVGEVYKIIFIKKK